MKKLLASAMALSCLLLCACGMADYDTNRIDGTTMPMESMMPEYEDGVVKDGDGVIEEREEDAQYTSAPERTAKP